MNKKQNAAIHKAFQDPQTIIKAMGRGIERALRIHKALGQSVVEWRDGKVVEIPPEEIDLDKFR
jgi:hypothetical protein